VRLKLSVLLGEHVFQRNRKKRVTEFCRMVRVPEECMVGVATHCCRQAGVRNVVEPEVGWIFLDGIHKSEDLHAEDMNALQELLKRQQLINPLVCRSGGRRGKCNSVRCRRQQSHVVEIGNNEMPCACLAQHQFAIRYTHCNLVAQRVGGTAGGTQQNVVAASLQNVEGVRVCLSSMLAKVDLHLLRDAGNRAAGMDCGAVTHAPPNA
jgi:hypothetical protein